MTQFQRVTNYVYEYMDQAISAYYTFDFHLAEQCFLALTKLGFDDCYINLAFMKRRGECSIVHDSALMLLNNAKAKKSAIYCVNKALCLLSGIDCIQDVEKAIQELSSADSDFYEALEWWSDETTVGLKESNIVLYLFKVTHLYPFVDNVSLESRHERALADGYCI